MLKGVIRCIFAKHLYCFAFSLYSSSSLYVLLLLGHINKMHICKTFILFCIFSVFFFVSLCSPFTRYICPTYAHLHPLPPHISASKNRALDWPFRDNSPRKWLDTIAVPRSGVDCVNIYFHWTPL